VLKALQISKHCGFQVFRYSTSKVCANIPKPKKLSSQVFQVRDPQPVSSFFCSQKLRDERGVLHLKDEGCKFTISHVL
jgi:hypothetical protein